MFLLEEYYTRHGIINIPVVNYAQRSFVYLYDPQNIPPIRMLHIWTDSGEPSPPMFVIDICTPKHDFYQQMIGIRSHANYFQSFKRVKLEWEDYEPFLMQWVCELPDKVIAIDGDQTYWAAVAAFSICFDGWIAANGTPAFKNALGVLLKHQAKEQRREAGGTFNRYLRENPALLGAFKESFYNLGLYGHWLARLINDRKEAWFLEYRDKYLEARHELGRDETPA